MGDWSYKTQFVGVVLLCVLAGCSVTLGSLPKTDRLETLQRGISSRADVLLVLGEPRGHGMARLAGFPPPRREIWHYEYAHAKAFSGRIHLKFLWVFFREDRYEGHFWFSSDTLLHREN
jgi:hypothetical protein